MTPLKISKVYSPYPPKGTHTIKIWRSQKEKGKYSFSIAYGAGVLSNCTDYASDGWGFGQFSSIDEAIEAATKYIIKN